MDKTTIDIDLYGKRFFGGLLCGNLDKGFLQLYINDSNDYYYTELKENELHYHKNYRALEFVIFNIGTIEKTKCKFKIYCPHQDNCTSWDYLEYKKNAGILKEILEEYVCKDIEIIYDKVY